MLEFNNLTHMNYTCSHPEGVLAHLYTLTIHEYVHVIYIGCWIHPDRNIYFCGDSKIILGPKSKIKNL